MSYVSNVLGGNRLQVGDFIESPDVGALLIKQNGNHLLRTGSLATGASYPQAQAIDFLKCTGVAGTINTTTSGAEIIDFAHNGAGVWVFAYGHVTNVLYSTDNGATISTVAHNAGGIVTSVCWSAKDSLFVSAGNSNTVFFTSTQTAASVGSAWTARTGTAISGSPAANNALVRASSAETVMLIHNASTNAASRSTNSTTWTQQSTAVSGSAGIYGAGLLSIGSGVWLSLFSGANQRSTNGGVSWSSITNGPQTRGQIAFGAGLVVGFDGSGNLWTSTDGSSGSWTNHGNPFGLMFGARPAWDGTRFICALSYKYSYRNFSPAYAYSTDGINWKIRGLSGKTWDDGIRTYIHSDDTNLIAIPEVGTASAYGTFNSTALIGIPYVIGSGEIATSTFPSTIQYVRIK